MYPALLSNRMMVKECVTELLEHLESFITSFDALHCDLKERRKEIGSEPFHQIATVNKVVNLLGPGGNKGSYVLKQTCS